NDRSNILRVIVDGSRKDKRFSELAETTRSAGIRLEFADKKTLDKLTSGARHQSVVAEYRPALVHGEDALLDALSVEGRNWLILVLDGVQDPHNLGACLRTADAAGVDAVIVPKDRAVGITPVVRKVAAGAADRVPFYQVTNLRRTLERLQQQGVWVMGTDDQAERLYTEIDYAGPVAIVMGAEGKGLRRLTRELCDELVVIPMAGSVSSLNVSVATGICLYEAVRQRQA
ncbi:MAG: 23S rRNA (guanosine(2251)-2'-O)-methyltransferase RlmB, partial [Gammaproteobacteria bacterium]|nr:23S rRNA (guanosine(2251)-2'-O)-methyltransferase RlmB [Gammaproteobacteria bacterium]